jgi:hypothetical protein
MNTPKKILIGCLCLFLFGFQSKKDSDLNLEGTWKLVSYKYGLEKQFSDVMPFIEYRKIVTKKHFTWVSYGESGNDVIGAGGGTYLIKDGKYVETSDFFHPMGTEIIGTSTAFDFEVTGNQWKIYGTVRAVSLDPKTGKLDKVEQIRLEEVWERI